MPTITPSLLFDYLQCPQKVWRDAHGLRAESLEFIRSFPPDDVAVYYYSAYEKSSYRRLRTQFSDVISEEDLEAIFVHPNVIDLDSIVIKMTDWPLSSYGIKAIAQYLKFE